MTKRTRRNMEICEVAVDEPEKKKEDVLFEYLKDTNSRSRQVLNDIWVYYFYNNISMLIKNIKELARENNCENIICRRKPKNEKNGVDQYLVTLNINIKSAYEYFDKLLQSIKVAYDYSRHNFIMYINNMEYEQSDEQYYRLINMTTKSRKFILEDSVIEFDNHMNNIIDAFYIDEKAKYRIQKHKDIGRDDIIYKEKEKEMRKACKKMKLLYNNLENTRMCVSNTFRILGDLFRFKCRHFSENKKKNEYLACVNYYRALNYFKFNGYIMNQLSLLYAQTNPIKGLFFYILSLVSINPAPNRDALVMFLERVLKEGKCLVEKSMEEKKMAERAKWNKENGMSYNSGSNRISRNSYGYRNKENMYFSFKYYKHAIRDIYNNEEYTDYNGNNNNKYSHRGSIGRNRLRDKRYVGKNALADVDKELAEKELKLTLIQLYVSYFKIVRLLFSRIDMNKFEKKKNKLLYYINRYVKIQHYNNKGEDKLLFRSICIIIFTLLSIVLYTIVNKHDSTRSKDGFFFYGRVKISKYIYKNEQIYFSFLLIYDILLTCENLYYEFYSDYLSVFIYTLYWLNNEKKIKCVGLDELTPEDGKERMKLIRQYHEDYKKKAMYIDMSYIKKESSEASSRKSKHAENKAAPRYADKGSNVIPNANDTTNEDIDYTDIIQNIYDLLKNVKIKNEDKLKDSLLNYKLKEDFYVYPFLNALAFERFEKSMNGKEKESTVDDAGNKTAHEQKHGHKNTYVNRESIRPKNNVNPVRIRKRDSKEGGDDMERTDLEYASMPKKSFFDRENMYKERIKHTEKHNIREELYHEKSRLSGMSDMRAMDEWNYFNDPVLKNNGKNVYAFTDMDKSQDDHHNVCYEKVDASENVESDRNEESDSTKDKPHKGPSESDGTFSNLFDFYTQETNFVIPSKSIMGDEKLEELVREARFISLLQSERNARGQRGGGMNIFCQPLLSGNGSKKKQRTQEYENQEREYEQEEETEGKGQEYSEDGNTSDESDTLTDETENGILSSKEIPNEEIAEHFIYYSNDTSPNICWDLCEIDYEESVLYKKKKKEYDEKRKQSKDEDSREKMHEKEEAELHDDLSMDCKETDRNAKSSTLKDRKSSSKNSHHRKYLNSEGKRTYVSSSSKGKIYTSESKSFGYTSDTSNVSSSGSSDSCSSNSSSSSSGISDDECYRNKRSCHNNTNTDKRKDFYIHGKATNSSKEYPYKNLCSESEKKGNEMNYSGHYRNKNTNLRILQNNNSSYKFNNAGMYDNIYSCDDTWKAEQESSYTIKKNRNPVENEDLYRINNSSGNKGPSVEQNNCSKLKMGEEILQLLRSEVSNKNGSCGAEFPQNEENSMNVNKSSSELEKENSLMFSKKESHVYEKGDRDYSCTTPYNNELTSQDERMSTPVKRGCVMERSYGEDVLKCRIKRIYTDYILIDGMNVGGECIEDYKKKFNIFRIKMVLDYYKSHNANAIVKIIMPREFLIGWNLFLSNNKNKGMQMKSDDNRFNEDSCYGITDRNCSSHLFSEYMELTGNDLLFFKHLNILELLIIQPLSTYYVYCIEYINDYKSCFVTNSTMYKVHSSDVSDYIVPYTFFENEFIPRVQILSSQGKCEGNLKRECYRE